MAERKPGPTGRHGAGGMETPGNPADGAVRRPTIDRAAVAVLSEIARLAELARITVELGAFGACVHVACAATGLVLTRLHGHAHARPPGRPKTFPRTPATENRMTGSAAMRPLSMLAACVLLAGCAGQQPLAYTGLASAPYLKANLESGSQRTPYLYAGPVNWESYSKAILDPVKIYRGADNQFGKMSDEDRAALARYMQARFAKALARRFQVTTIPGAGTLRIRLTLTGAAASTPVLSTLSRIDMAGGIYNAVQAVRGQDGMMTGWVMYAVEIYDAPTNHLLEAFVTKQYPGVYDLPATIGSLAAAKAGIADGAETLVEGLKR